MGCLKINFLCQINELTTLNLHLLKVAFFFHQNETWTIFSQSPLSKLIPLEPVFCHPHFYQHCFSVLLSVTHQPLFITFTSYFPNFPNPCYKQIPKFLNHMTKYNHSNNSFCTIQLFYHWAQYPKPAF